MSGRIQGIELWNPPVQIFAAAILPIGGWGALPGFHGLGVFHH
jgi:hypothetical protein